MIIKIIKILKRINPVLLSIFFVALLLRLWRVADQPIAMDEGRLISFASNFVSHGGCGLVSNWFHPVLRGPLIFLSALIFGNTPFGWRMLSVIAGTVSVILIFLISIMIFEKKEIAYMASIFLALDPLSVGWSRLGLEEVLASFFALLSIYLIVKHSRKGSLTELLGSACALGIALSLKWYFVLLLPLFPIFTLVKKRKLIVILAFLFIPLIIYLLTYLPYFSNGNDLKDWATLQKDMLITNLNLPKEAYGDMLGQPNQASKWFISPTYLGSFYFLKKDNTFRSVLWLSNPFTWLLAIPAIIHLFLSGLKKRNREKIFLALVFFSIYLPLVITSRPIFLYSAIPLLPLVFLAASDLLYTLHETYRVPRNVFYAYVLGAMTFSLYAYPLITYQPLLLSFYDQILKLFGIVFHTS